MRTLKFGRCLPSGRGIKRTSTHYDNGESIKKEEETEERTEKKE